MRHMLAIITLALAGPVYADESCPAAPNHVAALSEHLSSLREASNDRAALLIMNDMWSLWADAPDEQAQTVLDSGMKKRGSWNLLGAIEDFDRLVAYCPDYAEGYNQRAFARFLGGEYDAALVDLDRAIELSPAHIGAIAGRAMTLIALGRDDDAQADLRRAVALNPWLPERSFLKPEEPAEKL